MAPAVTPRPSRLARWIARSLIGMGRALHESACPDCAEGRTTYDAVLGQCVPRTVRHLDLCRGLITRA